MRQKYTHFHYTSHSNPWKRSDKVWGRPFSAAFRVIDILKRFCGREWNARYFVQKALFVHSHGLVSAFSTSPLLHAGINDPDFMASNEGARVCLKLVYKDTCQIFLFHLHSFRSHSLPPEAFLYLSTRKHLIWIFFIVNYILFNFV